MKYFMINEYFFIFSTKFLFTHLKILVNGIKLPETGLGCIVMIVKLFFALEHDSNSAMASGPAEPTFKGFYRMENTLNPTTLAQ